mmetsp:Transcript_30736/g.74399  ORF Transcript_30736/g.74399 Transcript_30736/m.74399 type:complete len:108 (+) Transcript_30736:50-373(+)
MFPVKFKFVSVRSAALRHTLVLSWWLELIMGIMRRSTRRGKLLIDLSLALFRTIDRACKGFEVTDTHPVREENKEAAKDSERLSIGVLCLNALLGRRQKSLQYVDAR